MLDRPSPQRLKVSDVIKKNLLVLVFVRNQILISFFWFICTIAKSIRHFVYFFTLCMDSPRLICMVYANASMSAAKNYCARLCVAVYVSEKEAGLCLHQEEKAQWGVVVGGPSWRETKSSSMMENNFSWSQGDCALVASARVTHSLCLCVCVCVCLRVRVRVCVFVCGASIRLWMWCTHINLMH